MEGGGSFKVILDTQQIWASLNWTIPSLFKKGGGRNGDVACTAYMMLCIQFLTSHKIGHGAYPCNPSSQNIDTGVHYFSNPWLHLQIQGQPRLQETLLEGGRKRAGVVGK